MIIEDDPAFLSALKDYAQEHGFKTLLAENGEAGLHLADHYQPSAIILDVGLPGINGWKVISRLKASPTTRHIPVHFISATEDIHEAIKLGAVGYLVKPVNPEQLSQVFAKLENIVNTPIKNLMVVESDRTESASIKKVLDADDITIEIIETGKGALDHLKKSVCHCIILGTTLSDMKTEDLLQQIKNDDAIAHIPVIVYAENELSNEERAYLDDHSERVITKNNGSLERLFEETTLFLHQVEANLPESQQQILRMVHDKESILKNKKVLLVDDDMRNIFALTSILEDKGIQVMTARNGREAIDWVHKSPDLDLVLMDIMMPEMDGYEAMRKIRTTDSGKKLPIIALTAKAMRGDRSKCIAAGANDYLAKPVDSEKLVSMLRVWLYR